MNSNRNDRGRAYRDAEREGTSNPEEGYNSRYETSGDERYYGEGNRFGDYSGDSNWNAYSSSPGNLYGMRGGEYSDYGPGYSTANDFSGQEPVRGRLWRSEGGRQYRGDEAPRYQERYRRREYPETYRSAMSGYMSEHVGDDRFRRDYNQNPNEGNLYGNRYGWRRGERPGDYPRYGEGGYMSEDDYDRGTPLYRANIGYGSEKPGEGSHKGKGPRNYRRADNRIREDINDRLTDDPLVDASEIDVEVKNGEVILSGTVDEREAKRRAEDIADAVSGVTQVENRIRVRATGSANPPPVLTPY